MITNSDGDKIYLGKKAGEYLLRDILNAKKSVKVISPYLSPSYIEKLLKLNKDVDVTLITADHLEEGKDSFSDFKHSDMIKQKQILLKSKKVERDKGIKMGKMILAISALIFLFSLLGPFEGIPITVLSIITFIFGIGYLSIKSEIRIYKYKYYSLINLKVIKSKYNKENINPRKSSFIHSKVFVIDDRIAYLGSVNFTFMAFNYNYETLTIVRDKNAIRNISKEVERLYNSNDVSEDIELWGKRLYSEPRN